MALPRCTLCPNGADPRHGIMTLDGGYYPLCDGCAPGNDADARTVALKCLASGRPSEPLGRSRPPRAGRLAPMSDGPSDANREVDFSFDPVFGICNACQQSHCDCANPEIRRLNAKVAELRANHDSLLGQVNDIALAVGLTIEVSFCIILHRVKAHRDGLAASEARVRELEVTLLAIVDGAMEASTDRTLSPGFVAYISVVEEVARAAIAKSRAMKRDGA